MALVLGATGCGSTIDPSSGAGASGGLGASILVCRTGEPYAGTLCGASSPCVVLDDASFGQVTQPTEASSSFASFGTIMAPSLALDASCTPHVLGATLDTRALFSSPDATGAWVTSTTPMPSFSAALAYDGAGSAYALAGDGHFDASLWKLADGAWSRVDALAPSLALPQSLRVDAEGALHTVVWDEGATFSTARFSGAWTLGATASVDVYPPVLAVSSTGAEHLAYWQDTSASPDALTKGFSWWETTGEPELVATGTLVLDDSSIAEVPTSLATSAPTAANPAGQPHVLFGDVHADGSITLLYATRVGASAWQTIVLADRPTSPACLPSAQCEVASSIDRPMGVAVSASGAVRLFYASSPATFSCDGTRCDATGVGAGPTTVRMATVDGSTVRSVPLVTAESPSVATVAIDAAGDIHLAFFEATVTAATTSFSTRYLRVGAAR